ncbi:neuropeptide FF receptor 2-like [Branchiostoma floridae]|uniref:Neuropeptide FF receptor 2-like n=1 Tax=Branchiostoma floridae TaxID=7739 RepID=A0A9J7KW51_BRAFL|nr:neuropeptide FF receptor 2-like [Branchiostoma floridae]
MGAVEATVENSTDMADLLASLVLPAGVGSLMNFSEEEAGYVQSDYGDFAAVHSSYKQSTVVMVIYILMYAAIFVLCVCGNTSVLYMILRTPKARGVVTNFFIMNLATGDLVLGLVNLPFTLVTYIYVEDMFGDALCKLVPFLRGILVCTSIFTVTAIAFERYYLVVYPTEEKISIRTATRAIMSIWVVAVFINMPIAMVHRSEVYGGQHICAQYWPADTLRRVYTCFKLITCYALPLIANALLNYVIVMNIWIRPPVKSRNPSPNRLRAVKILAATTVIFGLSWLPLHVCALLEDFGFLSWSQRESMHHYVYPVAMWMALANTCVNPVVYGALNNNLRESYRNATNPGHTPLLLAASRTPRPTHTPRINEHVHIELKELR